MQDPGEAVADPRDLGRPSPERAVELVVEEKVEAHQVSGQGEFVGPGVGVAERGEIDHLPVRVGRVADVAVQQRMAPQPRAVLLGGLRGVGAATVGERMEK